MTLPRAPPSTRPQRHRLDAFNFNKLKNNNFGYRHESRTSLNCSVRPPGCERLSLLATYTKPSSSSLVRISSPLTITLHEWLLRSRRTQYTRQVLGCLVPLPHVAPSVRKIPAYTPAAPSRRPTAPRNCRPEKR
ncbi:hypothetical protein DSO57_1019144 [Entomophthora muscae]|uniref:Uncharacterized protein n=1 Tax=Entomophthora muscae TaxID=34485 RepID=A0ACC2RV27_9FUNG|nr:hypothetical protein DSO57_1019144 [Entomophthora muscae]